MFKHINMAYDNNKNESYSSADKWRVSLLSGLIFLLVSAPFTYDLVDKLLSPLGLNVVSSPGCPSTLGLLVHTLVFVLVIRLLMK